MVNVMLVEFRVKNFRSLREEQVLSLVASADKTLAETHTLPTGLTAAPRLLKSAVLYGANASGKSNLIKALQYMREVVVKSAALPPGKPFVVQTFRLDTDSSVQPTEFEVTFILDGIRYQYGFAMTPQRIVAEHLLVYKTSKPRRWFERYFDDATGKDVYEFGPDLKGAKSVWERATRSNALFLSMAIQLNSEALLPVFDWFTNSLVIFNEQAPIGPQFSIRQMLEQPDGRKRICDFLSAADISITEINVETRKVPRQSVSFDPQAGKTEVRVEEIEECRLLFSHVTEKGEAVFDLMDESGGTYTLLCLAGPVLNILHKGLTMIIDELDTSLHPLLVRELVRLFHNPEVNTEGAQLIFTTHDTSLLDVFGLFRRDQVWLVEKDEAQASTLVALSEFSPRKNEALERGYLSGRYGAVPILSDSLGVRANGS